MIFFFCLFVSTNNSTLKLGRQFIYGFGHILDELGMDSGPVS